MTTRRTFLSLVSLGTGAATLAACSTSTSATSTGASASSGATGAGSGASAGVAATYPVTVADGNGELTIGATPQKVVVLDVTTMDSLAALGLADRVVGVVANGDTLPADLGDSYDLSAVTVAGTYFEPDYEKIAGLEPDLVIVGGRSAEAYEEVSKSFTTLLMPGSRDSSFSDKLEESVALLGQVFGISAAAQEGLDTYRTDVQRVAAQGSTIGTGLIVMTSGGEVTAFGPGSRFGLIHDDLAVTPAIADVEAATHGEAISFELINETNPDWLFVIDRDAAIGETGQSAQQVLDTELVTSTTAWSQDHVVYLDGARWYVVGPGLGNASAMVDEVGTAIGA